MCYDLDGLRCYSTEVTEDAYDERLRSGSSTSGRITVTRARASLESVHGHNTGKAVATVAS